MRKRWIVLSLALVTTAAAATLLLAPGDAPAPAPAAAAMDAAEHARTIEAMRPPRRARPVIAIVALNAATEITDLLVPYGVLMRADVADVTVVAERSAPVPLHPFGLSMGPELLRIEPQATTRAFDERHPAGADYVVVPAMLPRDDRFVVDWIAAQHRKGAKIVSVCAGALTVAAAGLLDGRRATTHWSKLGELQQGHPTVRWARDRRYVADSGVVTSTGISASMPVTLALVEAIAGRAKAERLAQELGIAHWDARHTSSAFQIGTEHGKTFVRNWLSFWRRETVGVPLTRGVDEIALALTADAYSRTALSTVVTVGIDGAAVRTMHGLVVHPSASPQAAMVDRMLPPIRPDSPALTMERVLPQIAERFDRPTADIVALTMEYPWAADVATAAH